MKNYWILFEDSISVSPDSVKYKAYYCIGNNKKLGYIKVKNNLYYCSLGGLTWLKLNPKNIIYHSDIKNIITIIYIISYIRLIIFLNNILSR